VRQSTRIR